MCIFEGKGGENILKVKRGGRKFYRYWLIWKIIKIWNILEEKYNGSFFMDIDIIFIWVCFIFKF